MGNARKFIRIFQLTNIGHGRRNKGLFKVILKKKLRPHICLRELTIYPRMICCLSHVADERHWTVIVTVTVDMFIVVNSRNSFVSNKRDVLSTCRSLLS